MAEVRIPVDLLNPGQVFACLGLMEAAAVLCGSAESVAPVGGGYVWEPGRGGRTLFTLGVPGDTDPVLATVHFLAQASVHSSAPKGQADLRTEGWQVRTDAVASDHFPFEPPNSPATLPAVLTGPCPNGRTAHLPIEYWGDAPTGTGRDNVKFWAGAGGYPGVALARDALALVAGATPAVRDVMANDPWAVEAPMSSSFRFDWRRDYVPLDAGYSPNKHGSDVMVGFPLVELLAAIGLQHARPLRIDKLTYRYAVAAGALPLSLARAVLGTAPLPFPSRTFCMRLGWPGKEGQSRCIVDTQEESIP